MRGFKAAILILTVFSVQAGCQRPDKNISVETIKESIVKEISLESPEIMDLGGNKDAAERFGLPLSKIKEGFVYASGEKSEQADEIVVIRAKDQQSVNEIERALESEITGLSNAWEGTDNKEFEKVQNHILRSKGSYILLAIGDNNKKAEEIFNGFFG